MKRVAAILARVVLVTLLLASLGSVANADEGGFWLSSRGGELAPAILPEDPGLPLPAWFPEDPGLPLSLFPEDPGIE